MCLAALAALLYHGVGLGNECTCWPAGACLAYEFDEVLRWNAVSRAVQPRQPMLCLSIAACSGLDIAPGLQETTPLMPAGQHVRMSLLPSCGDAILSTSSSASVQLLQCQPACRF